MMANSADLCRSSGTRAQNRIEAFKSSAQKIRSLKQHVFKQQSLLADGVSEEDLISICRDLTPGDYDEVVEERNATKLCGYPLCANEHKPCFKKHLILKEDNVRKMYCSHKCFKSSMHLKAQLDEEPYYLRVNSKKTSINLLKPDLVGIEEILESLSLNEKSVEDCEKDSEKDLATKDTLHEEALQKEFDILTPSEERPKCEISLFGKIWTIATKTVTKSSLEFLGLISKKSAKVTCGMTEELLTRKMIFSKNMCKAIREILSENAIEIDITDDLLKFMDTFYISKDHTMVSSQVEKRCVSVLILKLLSEKIQDLNECLSSLNGGVSKWDSILTSTKFDKYQFDLLLNSVIKFAL